MVCLTNVFAGISSLMNKTISPTMAISIISKWRGISFNEKLSIGKGRIKFNFQNHENLNAIFIILVNISNLFLIELLFICISVDFTVIFF